MLLSLAPLVLGLSVSIRTAVLSDVADAEALCAIRAPTQYVVEDGGVGFMGKRVELTPEEAFNRRVQARLGSAIRDRATVLIAQDDASEDDAIIGTVDCVELPEGKGRRALAPELPRRFLVRNLWVDEARRRQGLALQLPT